MPYRDDLIKSTPGADYGQKRKNPIDIMYYIYIFFSTVCVCMGFRVRIVYRRQFCDFHFRGLMWVFSSWLSFGGIHVTSFRVAPKLLFEKFIMLLQVFFFFFWFWRNDFPIHELCVTFVMWMYIWALRLFFIIFEIENFTNILFILKSSLFMFRKKVVFFFYISLE